MTQTWPRTCCHTRCRLEPARGSQSSASAAHASGAGDWRCARSLLGTESRDTGLLVWSWGLAADHRVSFLFRVFKHRRNH